jgi:CHRD domain
MNLLRIAYVLAAVLSLVVLNAPALADSDRHQDNQQEARLVGFQEVPSVITEGKGRFEMTIAPDDSSFTFTLSYEGIEGGGPTGAITQAHIHVGQKAANGAIVVFLCTNLAPPAGVPTPPACPPSPGTVSGTRTAADVISVPTQSVGANDLAAVLTAVRKGVAYANVHTAASPSGEIRGQIRDDHQHGHDKD